jgi:hypothetical protein
MEDDELSSGISYDIKIRVDEQIDGLVGLLAKSWAFLEFRMTEMLGALIGVSPEESRAIFTHMNMRPRLEVAASLAPTRLVYQRDRAAFATHKAAIEKAHEVRNLLIHGLWGKTDDGSQVILQTWGGKDGLKRITPEAKPMEYDDLDAAVGGVVQVINDFHAWWASSPPLMPSPYRDE